MELDFLVGTIYWIEHAPNPWVRAVAVTILGGIALFNWWSGAGTPNMAMWLGGYGACNDWNGDENTVPEFAGEGCAKVDPKLVALYRELFFALGPVQAALAFRASTNALGLEVTDDDILAVFKAGFPAPKPTDDTKVV